MSAQDAGRTAAALALSQKVCLTLAAGRKVLERRSAGTGSGTPSPGELVYPCDTKQAGTRYHVDVQPICRSWADTNVWICWCSDTLPLMSKTRRRRAAIGSASHFSQPLPATHLAPKLLTNSLFFKRDVS